MSRFEEIEAFLAVIDYAGFGKAAEKLGIAKSMVSRRVAELEHRLGVQLLQRTTRRQALTDAGREFHQRAAQILADLDEAEQVVADAQCQVSGRIRLALPLGFGIRQLAAPIADFLQQHPGIRIDVALNDRQVDLIEENIDLAIRIGELADSSLRARRLASVHFGICASPEYLRRFGEPRHPADLADHEVLVYSNLSVGLQWSFAAGGKKMNPRIRYRLSANNGEFLAAAAVHGGAIVSGPMAYLRDAIERGELVQIMRDYTREAVGMYAVYPPGRLVSRRVRVLSDALREHFRAREL